MDIQSLVFQIPTPGLRLASAGICLAQGNQAKAARWLGVTRLKMREKLMQFGLRASSEKHS